MAKQREDYVAYSDHLQAWLRGDDTPEALAAGIAIATLLDVARQKIVKE